jgi:bifunctional dethiobiotin synthetase / adenosylmethionine---8-amino-7-oxononanoate aminotransferase
MHDTLAFESKAALYSPKRLSSALAATYTKHIERALDTHEAENPDKRIGACLLEPGMQAAGGMLMLDPLFQNILAKARF